MTKPRPRREEDDLSLIADQRAVNGLVKVAIDKFGEANFLHSDGSNYVIWLQSLGGIGQNFLDNRDFFSGPCVRPRMVGVGRRIVLGVINPTMKSEFQDMATAWEVLEAIKARFAGVTKARMMRVFQQLSRVAVDISTNPARVATEMKALLDELNGMGTSFLYDDLLPILIHENVAPGTALCFEFDRCVDAEFSLNGHQPITFEKTWKKLSAAIHQVRSTEALEANQQQKVWFNAAAANV
ncbi:hypothetical protein PTTG_27662 [Puccinia triticina 1-1 BBBD Race 1]|uniref:Uncharacterized protein n=1 Tax=Puccinia triticina (isolate 1-1 / race 1 (BBBD)) TaxID=630390 RepID=A0A180GK77_PUCT1|nr:hypothetical protein PTTG_27662 [Puccinia triticina 1-1 BBBD Race 1]